MRAAVVIVLVDLFFFWLTVSSGLLRRTSGEPSTPRLTTCDHVRAETSCFSEVVLLSLLRLVVSQSYELEMTANDDAEFQEVREWENLFHDLIEDIMAGEGETGARETIIFNIVAVSKDVFEVLRLVFSFLRAWARPPGSMTRSTSHAECLPVSQPKAGGGGLLAVVDKVALNRVIFGQGQSHLLPALETDIVDGIQHQQRYFSPLGHLTPCRRSFRTMLGAGRGAWGRRREHSGSLQPEVLYREVAR